MKLVHTSDWHIGKIVNDFPMLEDQRYFLRAFCDWLAQEKPDAVIIAGDLYDRSIPPAEAVQLLSEVLSEIVLGLKIPVLAISGNHDSAARLSFGASMLSKQGLYLKTQFSELYDTITLTDRYGAVNFYFLPYTEAVFLKKAFEEHSPKNLQQAFSLLADQLEERLDLTQRNVLISHGFFANIPEFSSESGTPTQDSVQSSGLTFSGSEHTIGACDMVSCRKLEQLFDYVALGHLHAPQQAADHVRYSGSILKYSDSEAAQHKSVTVVELNEKGNLSVRTHVIPPLRDLRVLRGEMAQLMQYPESEDYVFIELTDAGLIPDAVQRLHRNFPNLMGLRYLWKDSPLELQVRSIEELRRKSTDELFFDFYSGVMPIPMNQNQQQLIQALIAAQEAAEEE